MKNWCIGNLPDGFFKDTSDIVSEYTQIVSWANSMNSHYNTSALAEFLDTDEADAWLIAYSLHHGIKLVTYERSNPNMKSKIKIPEPCNALGVQFVNTIEMFREIGETF